MPIVNRISGYADDMRTWRQWLHRNPELGFDLPKTSRFVADRLREFGVDEIHEGIAQSGIVGIIRGRSDGPTIGLRADMDALPIHEDTGASYASETDGKMHACGHDGHTTMLLGAAKYLAETRNFSGKVVLVFQPAEEIGGGAIGMLEEGLIERFGIERIFGLHTSPTAELGVLNTRPGPFLAAADRVRIEVRGVGGHAAHSHLARDPIPALVGIASALNTIQARDRAPNAMLVLTLTQFHAGTAFNVIPETGWIEGTVRTHSAEVRTMAERRVKEIAEGHADVFGVKVNVDYSRDLEPTVNDPEATQLAAEIAREVVGPENVDDNFPKINGSEDFGAFSAAVPGAFLFIGQGQGPKLHDPKFDFNDDAAPIGASFFARLVERAQPAVGS